MPFYPIEYATLDINESNSQVTFKARMGDINRRYVFTLSEGGSPFSLPENCVATLKAVKPDGTKAYIDCSIKDNTITFVMNSQLSAVAGVVECELDVGLASQEGYYITTPRFRFEIGNVLFLDSEIESSDSFDALITALSNVENIYIAIDKSGSTGQITVRNKAGETTVAEISDGISITSVQQTTSSNQDSGDNIITVTLSDGTTSTFTVKNGSKGSTGLTGKTGYTPKKGLITLPMPRLKK